MKSTSTDITLLENALFAIEKVLAHADSELRGGPYFGMTTELPIDFDDSAFHTEAQRFRSSPAQSAINICLSAAAALVDVSKALMSAPGDRSPEELEREFQAVIIHTKIASRSAHRAALLLAGQENALAARGIDAANASDVQALMLAY